MVTYFEGLEGLADSEVEDPYWLELLRLEIVSKIKSQQEAAGAKSHPKTRGIPDIRGVEVGRQCINVATIIKNGAAHVFENRKPDFLIQDKN